MTTFLETNKLTQIESHCELNMLVVVWLFEQYPSFPVFSSFPLLRAAISFILFVACMLCTKYACPHRFGNCIAIIVNGWITIPNQSFCSILLSATSRKSTVNWTELYLHMIFGKQFSFIVFFCSIDQCWIILLTLEHFSIYDTVTMVKHI